MLPSQPGAEAFGSGTNAIPSRARCGTPATWSAWGMATGVWGGVAGGRSPVRNRAERQRPWRRVRVRNLRHRHWHLQPSWRRSRRTCSGCRSRTSASKLWRSRASPAIARSKADLWIAASVSNCHRNDSRRNPRRAVAFWPTDAKFATRECNARRKSLAHGRQAGEQA